MDKVRPTSLADIHIRIKVQFPLVIRQKTPLIITVVQAASHPEGFDNPLFQTLQ